MFCIILIACHCFEVFLLCMHMHGMVHFVEILPFICLSVTLVMKWLSLLSSMHCCMVA